jgi:MarR family transcriptional regulator, lower aerobic nicotinate degradation pathway regulator
MLPPPLPTDANPVEFRPEESPAFLVARAHRAFKRRLNEVFASFDLTDRQGSVLLVLFREDGASAARLVEGLASDSSTVGSVIDRLEAKGLLTREPDPEDRRAHRHVLTPEARRLQGEMRARLTALNAAFLEALQPGELEALRSILERLQRVVEEGQAP